MTSSGTVFTDVAESAGLVFEHFIGATGRYYFAEIMGSGCALLDYDGDGDLDVYLVQGAMLEPGRKLSEALFAYKGKGRPRNRMFRNELVETGELRFEDVTQETGTGDTGYGMGAATGDYDNDGDVDLYVANFGADVLYRNEGNGRFTDVTREAGLGDPRWTTSATFADIDRDGYLDLAVVAYADFTIATNKKCFQDAGARDYCGPDAYLPLPARLYHNRGDGRFEEVTASAGMDEAYGHGLGVVARDFDQDGWVDIYVADDGDANQLWKNDHGRLHDEALLGGVAFNEQGKAEAGMGIACADFDGDGDTDLFLTHLFRETNTLYENLGNGVFEDATTRHGLGEGSLAFTGFGVAWFDMDHDTDLDLFIANGEVSEIESEAGEAYPFRQVNQLLVDVGGQRYEDRSRSAGDALALSEVSRGLASGDLDNDGDVDILITNNNGPVRLLRNDLEHGSGWLELRVIDGALGRDAVGARVRATLSDGRSLIRTVATDGSYLSARDPRVHFGWPADLALRSVEIITPEGREMKVRGVTAGSLATVRVTASGAVVVE